ncbi:hypothetical protein [Leucobacter chinensis]|uniref:hypothetical protein n=1 Tax=Leucobacter chinensis TaxID=2851010 RepID=UPI001C21B1FD|nr:hypothetical protein [Leucobacter chinensis]
MLVRINRNMKKLPATLIIVLLAVSVAACTKYVEPEPEQSIEQSDEELLLRPLGQTPEEPPVLTHASNSVEPYSIDWQNKSVHTVFNNDGNLPQTTVSLSQGNELFIESHFTPSLLVLSSYSGTVESVDPLSTPQFTSECKYEQLISNCPFASLDSGGISIPIGLPEYGLEANSVISLMLFYPKPSEISNDQFMNTVGWVFGVIQE